MGHLGVFMGVRLLLSADPGKLKKLLALNLQQEMLDRLRRCVSAPEGSWELHGAAQSSRDLR